MSDNRDIVPEFSPNDAIFMVLRGAWIMIVVALSCLLAGIIVTLGYRGLVTDGAGLGDVLSNLHTLPPSVWFAGLGLGLVFVQIVGLPAFIFAAIGAARSWRGPFAYLLLGFALGVGAPLIFFGFGMINQNEVMIFASAGAISGLFYWLFAGSWVSLVRRPNRDEGLIP